MQLLQTGIMALPFDTAAADTIRALSLMKRKLQGLTVVMRQAFRGHRVTVFTLKLQQSDEATSQRELPPKKSGHPNIL